MDREVKRERNLDSEKRDKREKKIVRETRREKTKKAKIEEATYLD